MRLFSGLLGDPAARCRYNTIFVDSITVAGRLCFGWCKGQPRALSEKTGNPDVRGACGLHGRAMIGWLTHLQHIRAKNVLLVGILDEKPDDLDRRVFEPQIDGSKTGLELPGLELPGAGGRCLSAQLCSDVAVCFGRVPEMRERLDAEADFEEAIEPRPLEWRRRGGGR